MLMDKGFPTHLLHKSGPSQRGGGQVPADFEEDGGKLT
jgi:hypothetical protein